MMVPATLTPCESMPSNPGAQGGGLLPAAPCGGRELDGPRQGQPGRPHPGRYATQASNPGLAGRVPRQVCYSHVRASPWTEWYRHEAEVDYPHTLKP